MKKVVNKRILSELPAQVKSAAGSFFNSQSQAVCVMLLMTDAYHGSSSLSPPIFLPPSK